MIRQKAITTRQLEVILLQSISGFFCKIILERR